MVDSNMLFSMQIETYYFSIEKDSMQLGSSQQGRKLRRCSACIFSFEKYKDGKRHDEEHAEPSSMTEQND